MYGSPAANHYQTRWRKRSGCLGENSVSERSKRLPGPHRESLAETACEAALVAGLRLGNRAQGAGDPGGAGPSVRQLDSLGMIAFPRQVDEILDLLAFTMPECQQIDRKSTRLNSSHEWISYA